MGPLHVGAEMFGERRGDDEPGFPLLLKDPIVIGPAEVDGKAVIGGPALDGVPSLAKDIADGGVFGTIDVGVLPPRCGTWHMFRDERRANDSVFELAMSYLWRE